MTLNEELAASWLIIFHLIGNKISKWYVFCLQAIEVEP
jgi:hypothetical protein